MTIPHSDPSIVQLIYKQNYHTTIQRYCGSIHRRFQRATSPLNVKTKYERFAIGIAHIDQIREMVSQKQGKDNKSITGVLIAEMEQVSECKGLLNLIVISAPPQNLIVVSWIGTEPERHLTMSLDPPQIATGAI